MRTASNRPIRSHRSHTHSRCAFVRVSKETVQPALLKEGLARTMLDEGLAGTMLDEGLAGTLLDEGLAGTLLDEGLAGTLLDEGRIRVVYFRWEGKQQEDFWLPTW